MYCATFILLANCRWFLNATFAATTFATVLALVIDSAPAVAAASEFCPEEATGQLYCKHALYRTEHGATRAIFRRECNWRQRSRDWLSLDDCNSYVETDAGRVEVPKAVADANDKIGKAMVNALGTRPDGFGQKRNLHQSQFPRFYDLAIEHTNDFCFRYSVKFPFGGDAVYCVTGPSDDAVRLIAPISLRDAIQMARSELKKRGLGQIDPDGLGSIGFGGANLRDRGNGKSEYVVVLYERQAQVPRQQARYPAIQYNFLVDTRTGEMAFAEAPFDTPVP
jgi:hypothetical protein